MTLPEPFTGLQAVLVATEKGDLGPLANYLRALARGAATLNPDALLLAAALLAPARRGPHTSPAQRHLAPPRQTLTVAVEVIRRSRGNRRGFVKRAREAVAKEYGRSESWVKEQVRAAKKYRGGAWWRHKVSKFGRK